MTDTPTRRHGLSFRERMDVADFLKSVIIEGEDGVSHYKPGWTDDGVAKRMKCTVGNVSGIRRQLYPSFLDKFKTPAAKAKAEAKISKLTELQAQVKDLQERMAYLEKELGVTPSK